MTESPVDPPDGALWWDWTDPANKGKNDALSWAVLDRLYPERDLQAHFAAADGADPTVAVLTLAEFASKPRTRADYHRRCLAFLTANPWATETDFVDALEDALAAAGR